MTLAAALVVSTAVVVAPSQSERASAAGTPDIVLTKTMPDEVLYGATIPVTLTVDNPTLDNGFNLTINDVLPAGVSYVGGSADPEPDQYPQGDGTTVLVWENVADSLAGTTVSVGFDVAVDTSVFAAGDPVANTANAYANSDERRVPDVHPVTGVVTGDFTGSSEGRTDSTELVPFLLGKAEPSPEDELLRGVHDHQTVYTLTVDNNLVRPTTGFTIVDHLPAGLEFLGCGSVDNSTAGTEEYPGSGRIDEGAVPTLTNPCPVPSSVTTVETDPDGPGGPLPTDVYTRVEWDAASLAAALGGSADLAAGGSFAIDYVAAIPLQANTLDPVVADATANLDNNNGPFTTETSSEQLLQNYAVASGNYDGSIPATDDAYEQVVAEDVSILKSVDMATVQQGDQPQFTLTVRSSEYSLATGPITVTDTLPDGVDIVSSSPISPDQAIGDINQSGIAIWTVPAFTGPSSTYEIEVETRVRTTYRSSGGPVSSSDGFDNTVDLATTSTTITDPVTDPAGVTQIDVADDSAAGLQASGPTILKQVANAPAGPITECGDGSGLTWSDTLAVGTYRPGDIVCWRLSVFFPTALDTLDPIATDYLPAGFEYEATVIGANNTYQLPGDGSLIFPFDDGTGVQYLLQQAGVGQVFEGVVQSRIVDPNAFQPGDLVENLMKFRYENTVGDVAQARDVANAEWSEAILDLDKAVETVNGGPPLNEPVSVNEGDVVEYHLDIVNSGSEPALDVSVRDVLPEVVGTGTPITCAEIASISNGGECDATNGWIQWEADDDIDIAPGSTVTLSYTLEVPEGVTPGITLTNHAGVRDYRGATNNDTPFTYVPADNIDPTLTPNTTSADDTAAIFTRLPLLAKSSVTGTTQAPGNNEAGQATIGEIITYTVEVNIAPGTTVTDGVLSDVLDAEHDLVASSVTATVDGTPVVRGDEVPDEFRLQVADATNEWSVTAPNPFHNPSTAPNVVLQVVFDAVVTDVASNTRNSQVQNVATMRFTNALGDQQLSTPPVRTRIVEPNIEVDKRHDDVDGVVGAGQTITYTVDVTNRNTGPNSASVSTANDTVVVDTVPDTLTVLDASSDPADDGDVVDADGGVWDETARTITWTIATIAPGASQSLSYQVLTADPIIAAGTLTNTADATTTSLPGTPPTPPGEPAPAERSATSPHGGPATGYQDGDDSTVEAPLLSLTKTGTPDAATVGEPVEYELTVTIPAGVAAYDVTVIDDLPAGIAWESLDTVTCVEGAGACAPTAPVVSTDGDTVSFFFGDLLTPSADDRVVTISYTGVVADVTAADAGNTLTNGAEVYWNPADEITDTPAPDAPLVPGQFTGNPDPDPDTHDVDTVEPTLTIDKDVAGQIADDDNRRAVPGEVLTYSITVTNTGTSAAFDATVTDVPTDDTWAFVDTTVAAGVTNTDSDPVGGLEWTIDGPIAPNASVVITYTLTVPDTYDSSNEVVAGPEQVNTADVPSYWAVDETTRTANPDRDFREYDDVVEDTVEIELDLASIGDFVWFDVNDDGVQDPGEPVLADVTVTVTYHGPDGVLGGGDDEVFVVVTDENGLYLVEDLPGGQYTVDVDEADPDFLAGLAPTYDLDGGTAGPNGVWTGSLDEDQDHRDVDFGYTGTGTIGDTIWLDQDLDGVQDAGEAGLAGVGVTVTWHGPNGLLGGGDDIVYTTTTDTNGNYLVEDLPAGAYTVAVDTDDIPSDYVNVSDPDTSNPGDSTSTLLLGPGASDLDQDFGYAGSGSIGDTIWLDTNGDGVQDVGETGLSGVVVEVVHGGPDGIIGNADDSLFTATTDAKGNYLVENLPYGPYEVTVTGAITALDNTGDPDDGADSTSLTELTPAEPNDLDQDFGYQGTSVLGDRVWLDLNADGVQDAAGVEPGLAGITVTATGPNDAVIVTTTDDAGSYLFPNIFDGEWTVTIDTDTLPDGLAPTGDDDGLGTPNASTTDLVTSDLDQDFGYAGPGRIGDTVWLDLDGDGTINGDEAGLGGVTVTLEWAQPSGPPIVLTTTTAADGTYSFDNLPLGDYTVTVDTDTLPAGVAATFDFDGGDDSTSDVTLTVDEPVRLDQDFGYQGAGTIGDTVWFDRDGDGVFDADETPLPGVTVELVWDGPDGPETFTTVTDTNGEYLFERLAPGDYTVTVDTDTLPAGMVPTFDADGGLDSTSSLTLADGEVNLDQDFGYQGAGSIGDTIWLDLDGDGVQGSNEPGIPGQTVELVWVSPNGPITYTTTTDDYGNYLFDNLPPADYTVTVVGGIVDDAVNTGDPGDDGDSTNSITLADGEDDLDQDFGYQGINAIGDTVWYDVNADGIDDGASAEPRLGGVDVSVVWFGVDGIEGTDDDVTLPTTTTNVDGLYLVTGLPDGSYSVTATDGVPAGLDTITYNGDGATADLDGTSIVTDLGVGVDMPVVDIDQDFGYTGTGSVGDTIWLDQNADGVVDPDESGIPGAEVTVTWAGPDGVLDTADDLVYPTVTTDENGNYLVDMLPAGPFRVDVANIPAGLSSTFDPDGGADDTAELTLDPGESNLDQDFGYVGDASIGDTVFVDVDADGVQDLDEPGVPGVTVTVTSPGADGVLGTADDIVVTTVTDEAGQYLVDGLPAGTTTVSYDPADLDDGYEPDSDLDGGDPTVTTVELETGDNVRDVDFGIVGDASLDGVVYEDTNNNGVQDPGEPGIPDVTVIVTWDGPDGPVDIPVTTDEDGNWELPTVPPGDYTAVVDPTTVPAGLIPSTPDVGEATVPPGGTGSIEHGHTPTGSIGDRVWNDTDRNGRQDSGEPGVPGVVVTLLDGDGVQIATTTTDGAGNYRFDGLPAGRYTVVVDTSTLPARTEITWELDGSTNGQVAVTLGAGQDIDEVDFGISAAGSSGLIPGTGSTVDVLLLIGAALLAGGAALLTSTRRKRRSATAAT